MEDLAKNIKDAIGSHGAWKLRLRTAINVGHSKFTVSDVSCDGNCAFGQWLQSDAFNAETRNGAPYRVISRLHTEFHKCAGNVLDLATSGHGAEATTLLDGDFTQQSEKLVRGLQKWRGEAASNAR